MNLEITKTILKSFCQIVIKLFLTTKEIEVEKLRLLVYYIDKLQKIQNELSA